MFFSIMCALLERIRRGERQSSHCRPRPISSLRLAAPISGRGLLGRSPSPPRNPVCRRGDVGSTLDRFNEATHNCRDAGRPRELPRMDKFSQGIDFPIFDLASNGRPSTAPLTRHRPPTRTSPVRSRVSKTPGRPHQLQINARSGDLSHRKMFPSAALATARRLVKPVSRLPPGYVSLR
jgi:hypothetical protein